MRTHRNEEFFSGKNRGQKPDWKQIEICITDRVNICQNFYILRKSPHNRNMGKAYDQNFKKRNPDIQQTYEKMYNFTSNQYTNNEKFFFWLAEIKW